MSKLDQARAAPVVGRLSEDALTLAQQASQQINELSFLRAMQEGYKMACRDHGIDEPDFDDPITAALAQGA